MSSRESGDADCLPPIPRAKHSLVEASGRRSARSGFEDSGVDLRESLSVSGSSASGAGATNGRSDSRASITRSTPNLLVKASTLPISPRPQSPLRRSLEYVRMSRGELDRKEQTLNALRAENVQLQAQVRELDSYREGYATLQSACANLGQSLGCSVEGVAAQSVGEILHGRLTALTQDNQRILQQLGSRRSELEVSQSELAAARVRLSSLEGQLEQARRGLVSKDTQLKQLRSESEALQQSGARTQSVVQTLRQQLTETEEKRREDSSLTDLQTQLGRLRSELSDKDNELKTVEGQLAVKQAEQDGLHERLQSMDTAYGELTSHLCQLLQVEPTDSHDSDYLISEVNLLVQEVGELRLKVETMGRNLKTAELDSRASRETILRLTAEMKKHEQTSSRISELQQALTELQAAMASVEGERDSLQERLLAAKETLSAQEEEVQAKEGRIQELSSHIHTLRQATGSEREATEAVQLQFEELCKGVADLTGAQSTDPGTVLGAVEQLSQNALKQQQEVSRLHQFEAERGRLEQGLSEAEEALHRERSKVGQLEGELVSVDMVKEGLSREVEKHKSFHKRLAKALQLDSATADIIAGDFAEDALLLKAEQLAKRETEALASRQSAMYSLQRKLKASRQTAESKDLHTGFLQKKVAALEEKLKTVGQHDSGVESAVDKCRRLEKQLERLQKRVAQQRDTITQLSGETQEVHTQKVLCSEQEARINQLMSSVEQLTQAKVQQARQLAELRQKLQADKARDRSGQERLEAELRVAQSELEKSKEREEQLSVFKTAAQRLLDSGEGDTPSDYDLMARLETMVAAQRRHRETAKCLEASLRQLELGFTSGYNDALTLLNSADQ